MGKLYLFENAMGNVFEAEADNQALRVKDESAPKSPRNKTEASDLRPELVRMIIENNQLRQQTNQMNLHYMEQLNKLQEENKRLRKSSVRKNFKLALIKTQTLETLSRERKLVEVPQYM